ncbi:Uma2 family endonuclease [Nocardia sp. NBC_01503]|uniref:Uma2 family endonuclease n=1 Tax=Nocardia sp. NBC_01503 TaxID=2975997 RepID=UPI002E7BA94E|nr:Uma2 family endonuclease [Nocardia sp. NBC_01503]WTL35466.1 Uma2 family endonuclease [Nocardia sp. NBC_01503]
MTVEMQPISHNQPISVEEFDALPVDNSLIYEIENGLLLVNARPAPPHSRAIVRLAAQINAQLPAEWEALPELEAELPVGDSQRRVPDLVIAPDEVDEQTRVRSDQIALAIEIASSGESALRDYSMKSSEYAANGIAHYWVIDLLDVEHAAVGLTIFVLGDNGRYTIQPRVTGTVRVDEPFPLVIDLDALSTKRKTEG